MLVGVEPLRRRGELGLELNALLRHLPAGDQVQVARLHGLELGQGGVALGLGVEDVEADDARAGGLELIEHLRDAGPGPGPAAQARDGLVVDGDDDEVHLGLQVGAELGARVVSLELQGLEEGPAQYILGADEAGQQQTDEGVCDPGFAFHAMMSSRIIKES